MASGGHQNVNHLLRSEDLILLVALSLLILDAPLVFIRKQASRESLSVLVSRIRRHSWLLLRARLLACEDRVMKLLRRGVIVHELIPVWRHQFGFV